jgi:hypothetical protein
VTGPLLNELQDLHDRIGECLPSLFRHLVVGGCDRIARAFGLSSRLAHLCVAYHRLPGPRILRPVVSPPARDITPPPTQPTQPTLGRASEGLKLVA